jgi:hypothetical protein
MPWWGQLIASTSMRPHISIQPFMPIQWHAGTKNATEYGWSMDAKMLQPVCAHFHQIHRVPKMALVGGMDVGGRKYASPQIIAPG